MLHESVGVQAALGVVRNDIGQFATCPMADLMDISSTLRIVE